MSIVFPIYIPIHSFQKSSARGFNLLWLPRSWLFGREHWQVPERSGHVNHQASLFSTAWWSSNDEHILWDGLKPRTNMVFNTHGPTTDLRTSFVHNRVIPQKYQHVNQNVDQIISKLRFNLDSPTCSPKNINKNGGTCRGTHQPPLQDRKIEDLSKKIEERLTTLDVSY